MLSDEIDSLGLFTAGLKPLQEYNYEPLACPYRLNTAGAVNHFLPVRHYASIGNSDRNVSVRHAPVLCQNEEI